MRTIISGVVAQDLPPIFHQDFDDDVAELDVHDGGDGFLLGPQESGAETDAQVGHGHHVPFGFESHFFEMLEQQFQHPFVGFWELIDEAMHFLDAFLVSLQF